MTFIPVNTRLLQAVKANDALKVEELIVNADKKYDLITEHVELNGQDCLVNLLPQFKSKGLVFNITNLLKLEE